jgi:hypothetical protein
MFRAMVFIVKNSIVFEQTLGICQNIGDILVFKICYLKNQSVAMISISDGTGQLTIVTT